MTGAWKCPNKTRQCRPKQAESKEYWPAVGWTLGGTLLNKKVTKLVVGGSHHDQKSSTPGCPTSGKFAPTWNCQVPFESWYCRKTFSPDSDSCTGFLLPIGGGRRTTLADWTWHQGAIAGCSGRGAIPLGHRRVPLQGAIVVCYGWGGGWRPTLGEYRSVLREGDDQLWRSGSGAIAGCHCSVLWLGGGHCSVLCVVGGAIVVCYGWGRPTLGEWMWCHCWVPLQGCQFLFHIFLLYSGPPISPRHPRKQQWILFWASCRRCTVVLYIDVTKFGFCYPGSMLV